jgi:hypothetical protein
MINSFVLRLFRDSSGDNLRLSLSSSRAVREGRIIRILQFFAKYSSISYISLLFNVNIFSNNSDLISIDNNDILIFINFESDEIKVLRNAADMYNVPGFFMKKRFRAII